MKVNRKLFVTLLLVILLTVSFVTSTFSWYTHNNNSNPSPGNKINYAEPTLPVSVKSAANTISMTTYESDQNGVATSTVVTSINLPANGTTKQAVKYYKTVFTNSGANDVMVDLETSNLPNNADFYIGTVSPTLNEKAYASRAVRNKISDTTVRVYFKTKDSFSDFWSKDNGSLDTSTAVGSGNGTKNDINIAYTVGSTVTMAKMTKCPTADSASNDSSNTTNVYWYDVPTNADSFFFFNHWYMCSNSNREWNRTIDITDMSAGRLYYLTGNKVDGKWKEYAVRAVDSTLVALNQHYSSVRMSMGNSVFADIGLKKDGDTEDFVPDYYGKSIEYSSESTSVATVNKDGLVTPVAQGSTTITTKITGRYGDIREVSTTVDIPEKINQIPIIKNVKVPAQSEGTPGRVEVDWYALNRNSTDPMTTSAIYFTI